jgi:hypothetical protein
VVHNLHVIARQPNQIQQAGLNRLPDRLSSIASKPTSTTAPHRSPWPPEGYVHNFRQAA